MLTVDFRRLDLRPGQRVLDVGCGEGRHAFECRRLRAALVVALDLDGASVERTVGMLRAMGGEGAPGGVVADARRLPFEDATFDRVICAETLEHIEDDVSVIAELVRVLRPGGRLAVTVPRAGPERVCWRLSRAYYDVPGGHVRIYRASELAARLESAGLAIVGRHHAHALHSPYWWLRCAFGPPERSRVARLYQRLLEWDIRRAAATGGSTAVGRLERLLDPLLGKSVVLYCEKPPRATASAA